MQKKAIGSRFPMPGNDRLWLPETVTKITLMIRRIINGKFLLAMRLTAILLTVALVHVYAEDMAQHVSVSGKDLPLKKVFTAIEAQTGYTVFYNRDLLSGAKPVSLNISRMPLQEFLEMVLKDQALNFRIAGKSIILSEKRAPAFNAAAVLLPVTGQILDAAGKPLPGATIRVRNSKTGAVTDENGRFSLSNIPDNAVLDVSAIGFTGITLKLSNNVFTTAASESVILSASPSSLLVRLARSNAQLNEVVVNKGYYTESSRFTTGSVDRVSGETIGQQPVTNVMGALAGRIPGLEIVQSSGMVGAGFTVRIRGQNSIAAGNDPLFVIDGVPFDASTLGDNQVSRMIVGNGISPLNSLSPDDIASIDVLKDADATAIYGSRGANGVILITTKKGKAGKTKYDFNVSYGSSRITRFMDYMNTEEYIMMRKEAFANDGFTTIPDDAYDINGTWDMNRYTDWQKVLLGGTAGSMRIQGAVSGGTELTQFLVRGSFHRETTVFPGDFSYRRGSATFNVNHRSENKRFNISLSANYSTDDNNAMSTDLTYWAPMLPPNAPELYNADGSLNWANSTWENPLHYLEGTYDGATRNLNTNMVIGYQFLPGLDLKTNIGYSEYKLDEYMANPSTMYDPAYNPTSQWSYVYANYGTRQSWLIEPQLNWQKTLGDGMLQVLAGTSFQRQAGNKYGLYGDNFSSNKLIFDITAANNQSIRFNIDQVYKYHAVFGRVNYRWKEKYLVNLTARRDGSSRFGPGRQFANFGAAGLGWIFSEEAFVKRALPFLGYGKLRGSYGITGNDQIGDYEFLNTYAANGNMYDNAVGLVPQRLYNPDFSWENNRKLEIALELGMLKDRLMVNASWYKHRSGTQLVGIPLPGVTGFTSIQANLDAVVENSGWEIDAQFAAIRKTQLNWNMSFNISIPRNKLVSYPGLEQSSYSNTYVVGQPLSIRKLYNYLGIDPQTGIYQFEDVNKDGLLTSLKDRSALVNTGSLYYGGFANNLRYRKWQADVFFQFVKKTDRNYLYSIPMPGIRANMPRETLNRWQAGKTDAIVQRYTTGSNSAVYTAYSKHYSSTAAYSDASFIRLKNVELSYRLNIPNGNCRFYVQAQNLLTLTKYRGYDPENAMAYTLPPLRTLVAGLQLTL